MQKEYDITCIGLQVIDLIVSTVPLDIFTRELVQADSVEMHLGGDALNQAVTAANLGAKTVLMGAVGSDRLGDILLSQLEHLPLISCSQKVNTPTTISVVMLDSNRERHFVYQPGHIDHLSYEHLDKEIIQKSKVVSIGGFLAMEALDGEGIVKLLRLAKESGAFTVMDSRVTRDNYDMSLIREALSLTDYFLPSEVETRWLTGETNEPHIMAQKLHELGAKSCIIKLGSKGCYVSAEGMEKLVPTFAAKVLDTTGAGDTFTGAFCYAKTQNLSLEECVRFANAAGSIAVEHLGANGAVKNVQQVLDRMNTQ